MFVFAVGFLRLASDLQTTIKRIKILIKWEWECLMLYLSQKFMASTEKEEIKLAFLKVSSPYLSLLSCLTWWRTISAWTCLKLRRDRVIWFVFFQILTEYELMYHIFLMILCVTGLCMHPFFYSILVSSEFKILLTIARPLLCTANQWHTDTYFQISWIFSFS